MISSSESRIHGHRGPRHYFRRCQILRSFALYKRADNVRLSDDPDHSSVRSCDGHPVNSLVTKRTAKSRSEAWGVAAMTGLCIISLAVS